MITQFKSVVVVVVVVVVDSQFPDFCPLLTNLDVLSTAHAYSSHHIEVASYTDVYGPLSRNLKGFLPFQLII